MGRVSEGVGRTARQSAAHGKGVPRASRPHIELEPAHTPAHMPLTVTHSQDANGCSLDDKMSALNSWGAQKTYMDVTPSNFQYAMTFEPTIVSVHKGSAEKAVPPVQEVYARRESEFEDRERQEQLQRRPLLTRTRRDG